MVRRHVRWEILGQHGPSGRGVPVHGGSHLVRLAVWTVPMDLAEKWMRKYRARWEETPPVWFTPEWREALPPQLRTLLAAEGK